MFWIGKIDYEKISIFGFECGNDMKWN